MQEVWSRPVTSAADLLLRTRFMEFAELRYNAGDDVWKCYADPARNLVSGQLEFFRANPSFGAMSGQVSDPARFLGVTEEDIRLAIDTDPRFAHVDELIRQIVDLEVRQEAAFVEHDAATIASCKSEHEEHPLGAEPWVILHGRLTDQINDVASAETESPCRDWLDLAFKNKLADYYVTVGDAGGMESNGIVASFVRDSVKFWGFEPQKSIDVLKPPRPPQKPIRQGPSRYEQRRQLVLDTRSKIRNADLRLKAALKREDSLVEGTPAHFQAMRVSKRRIADLERLTKKVLPTIDDLPMAEGYQLQCELISAHRPDFIETPSGDRGAQLLQRLLRYGRRHGDWIVEDTAYVAKQSSV